MTEKREKHATILMLKTILRSRTRAVIISIYKQK